MARKVIWTLNAQIDKKQILNFWFLKTKSKDYSEKLNLLFLDSIKLIQRQPEIGKMTNISGVKIKIVKDYFLIYEFTSDELVILSIFDSRQNPVKLGSLTS